MIKLSAWTLVSLPSAAAAGFLVTLFGCVRHGLRHSGLFEVLKNEWRTFGWIAVIDAFGASAASLGLWSISPSRLGTLATLSTKNPAILWTIVGLTGPLVAAGLLGRAPRTSYVKVAFSDATPGRTAIPLKELRRSLAIGLYALLDQTEDVWLRTQSEWLVVQFRKLLREGTLDFDAFIEDLEASVASKNSRRRKQKLEGVGGADVPNQWLTLKAQWAVLPNAQRSKSKLPISMVRAGIRGGLIFEIAGCSGIKMTDFSFSDNYVPRTGAVLREPVEVLYTDANPVIDEPENFPDIPDPRSLA